MIDLDKLEAEREAASQDKADLFDFYHKHWPSLVDALRARQIERSDRAEQDWFGESK